MPVALFGVIRVAALDAALDWYERLLGKPFTFRAHETEVVWELAENRSLAVKANADPGGAEHVVIVDDLDGLVAGISARGIEPDERQTYSNGVRKVIYRHADGNETGFGGLPAS